MNTSPIWVLQVDDDPSFLEVTGEFLKREDDRFTLETASSADEGLDQLRNRPPDCIVSDYDMPGKNGIEFLQAVRETHPDLPFILFTGKGTESVASDAIAAGVTDYLQKNSGTEQYELLANRVTNAVQARRKSKRAERRDQLMRLTEFAGDTGGFELDTETGDVLMTDGTRRILHLPEQANPDFEKNIKQYHPDDRDEIRQTIQRAIQTGEQTHGTFRYRHPDAEIQQLLDITYTPATADEETTIIRGVIHDITERQERRQDLERQKERLEEFASVVSHDLRNPLQVAEGRLELAQAECDSVHLDDVAHAIDRSQALIEDLLTLAQEGEGVSEVNPVALADAAESSWRTVESQLATLEAHATQVIQADQNRLKQLFENLYRNAIEHGGDDVTVSVGSMDGGFYVADTGPGIPEGDREKTFEAGYSTAEEGTGFGLRIVEQVVEAHGWDIRVTDSDDDGTRFEITGVNTPDQEVPPCSD